MNTYALSSGCGSLFGVSANKNVLRDIVHNKINLACGWCSYYMLIYPLITNAYLDSGPLANKDIIPRQHSSNYVLLRKTTGYFSVMCLVLSYHAVGN